MMIDLRQEVNLLLRNGGRGGSVDLSAPFNNDCCLLLQLFV